MDQKRPYCKCVDSPGIDLESSAILFKLIQGCSLRDTWEAACKVHTAVYRVKGGPGVELDG